MKLLRLVGGWILRVALLIPLMAWLTAAPAQGADEIRVTAIHLVVEVSTDDGKTWARAQTNQLVKTGDRVRTGPFSRATLLAVPSATFSYPELTEVKILPPAGPGTGPGLHIFRGLMSILFRTEPGRLPAASRAGVAGVKGTEFVMAVDDQDRLTLSVIEGEVEFTNAHGALKLTSGEFAVLEEGAVPVRAAVPVQTNLVQWANNLLQWAFYYPAVLDPRDLALTPDETQALAASLAAYQAGDLPGALTAYGARQPASEAERIYRAALLLSVGKSDESSAVLAQLEAANTSERGARLAAALRLQIATVQREPVAPPKEPGLTTELLAASYFEQSRAEGDATLQRALDLAKRSASNAPQFGFAWVRVAELEFSFGRTRQALDALEKSLALSPRNAQALALKGFLLAAQNQPRLAIEWFDRAIATDPSLANAWLGRGLCRIRRGDVKEGREDLLLAAALEPRRAQLRSYLGKAFGDAGDKKRALHELDLAKQLDPADPTAWLYSALLKAEHNRVNEGIHDLGISQELNDNRSVYRSQFLLDQDEAMRRANMARLYADADLTDVAVREAGRAVSLDYANYSAHLFLANSYEVERRANLSNLRFEALAFNEYLLANLLGPANGGLLAQSVSQLEYSKMFDRNRLGLIANTEYFGRGAWHHSSAQYGTLNNSSYSLEAEYRYEPGERKNQDLEIRQLEAKFKHDLTPDDSLYFHVIDYRAEGGDTAQHFDENAVSRTARFEKEQTPTVLAGYHRQWSPQNHTLFLAGRLDDSYKSEVPISSVLVLDRFLGTDTGLAPVIANDAYRSGVELYSVEAQQIAVMGPHSLIAGARAEWSEQRVREIVKDPNGDFLILLGTNNPVSIQREDVWATSAAIYAYDYWRLHETFQLVGGLNYTHQSVPVNTGTAPVSSDREHQEQINPKAAFIWSPSPANRLRGSYTRSLTGFGPGQSVRLEPAHVAGLPQAFRDPAPRSLVGALDGADTETSELLWEGRFRDTYLSLGGQRLVAERNRKLGLFLSHPDYDPPPTLGLIRERVRFREHALDVSAHQLLGDEWSVGVRYRLAYAQLKRSFPEYPGLGVGGVDDRSDWRGWLHTVNLSGLYRHQSGVFGRAEGIFFAQDREREGNSLEGDDFWQVNLIAGYRFPRQKAEVAVGVLNVLDDDYRLDPINRHAELPRARTFYARLLLNF